MFHEVSLRSLFDHLETHALVQIECRVHAQDSQPQRQADASRLCEELLDQLGADSAPLMRGKDEDLRKLYAVGLSLDDPNADRLAVELDAARRTVRDVRGRSPADILFAPFAPGRERVLAHRVPGRGEGELAVVRCRRAEMQVLRFFSHSAGFNWVIASPAKMIATP